MLAAATVDVIPLVPVQEPPLRPSSSSATSWAADMPAVIVTAPAVTSTRPLPARSRPATLVVVCGVT